MISDWTIYAVLLEASYICPDCFKRDAYEIGEGVFEALAEIPDEALETISYTDLVNGRVDEWRKLWSHNGISERLSEDLPWKPWDNEFPVKPMISAEMGGWEEEEYNEETGEYEYTGPHCMNCGVDLYE